ncbi:MAG: flap endonuclease-1 [Candidatus Micrarchaeia archaeon]
MAVDLSKLISKRELALEELSNKIIAIDAYNFLYQFLSIIRQPDGTPLMDSHGEITSHLSGIFFKTINFIIKGIKPIYVFDGIPSMLKQKTIEARMNRREEAYKAWQADREAGNIEAARTHAMASTRVTKDIVRSAKELLDLMGVGYIDAPSEGEAQASFLCQKGLVYATASQDYDTLLLGSPLVVRNLTMTGKRKLPNKNVYINVVPELVSLEDTLKNLGINRQQLIWIGILLGTDFNEGVKGIGPKTALKIAKGAESLRQIENEVKTKYNYSFELDPSEIETLFLKPEVKNLDEKEINALITKKIKKQELLQFMCNEHDFIVDRVEKYIDLLDKSKSVLNQKSIGEWFQ